MSPTKLLINDQITPFFIQAVGKYYAIGTSHGRVLVFGMVTHYQFMLICACMCANELLFDDVVADTKEQLKCVLSPYQKGVSDVDGKSVGNQLAYSIG